MRILITGVIAFLIWCFFSAWLYNDKLRPVFPKPVPVQVTPENQTHVADSLMKLKASMPKDLLIYFEFNDAKFKPDPKYDQSIADFNAWLNKYPGSMVLVTGLTDIVGTPEYNQELGLKRANAVSGYLKEKGVAADRIKAESLGKSRAGENYITKEGRAKSRRAEITIKMQ